MTWSENLFSNLLTIFILLSLFIVIYLKITKKKFIDLIRGIKEMFSDGSDQVYDTVQGGFENIV